MDADDLAAASSRSTRKVLVYGELSYRVMRAVFEVHRALGPGLAEKVYEEALVFELEQRGIPFERQRVVRVYYKGEEVGIHRLDLVVDGKIVVELKATSELTDLFKQQVVSYLKASGLRLGILVNLGTPSVQYVRIVN